MHSAPPPPMPEHRRRPTSRGLCFEVRPVVQHRHGTLNMLEASTSPAAAGYTGSKVTAWGPPCSKHFHSSTTHIHRDGQPHPHCLVIFITAADSIARRFHDFTVTAMSLWGMQNFLHFFFLFAIFITSICASREYVVTRQALPIVGWAPFSIFAL